MKKRIVLLIILIISYFISIYVVNIFNSNKKIVFLGNYTKIYIGNKIKIIDDNYKINNKKIKIYFNNEMKDAYLKSIKNDLFNNYIVYNDLGENLTYANDLIATTRNVNISIIEPVKDTINKTEFDKMFDELEVNKNKVDYDSLEKYAIDLNKDVTNEYIIFYNVNESEEKIHQYIMLKDNNDYEQIIDTEINPLQYDSVGSSLFKFIDIDNDGVYEIVLSRSNGDLLPSSYDIYSYNGVVSKL